jgi:hypothetical protein
MSSPERHCYLIMRSEYPPTNIPPFEGFHSVYHTLANADSAFQALSDGHNQSGQIRSLGLTGTPALVRPVDGELLRGFTVRDAAGIVQQTMSVQKAKMGDGCVVEAEVSMEEESVD